MEHVTYQMTVAFLCGFILVWGMFQAVDWGR